MTNLESQSNTLCVATIAAFGSCSTDDESVEVGQVVMYTTEGFPVDVVASSVLSNVLENLCCAPEAHGVYLWRICSMRSDERATLLDWLRALACGCCQ